MLLRVAPILCLILFVFAGNPVYSDGPVESTIRFNRDIRPLLAETCLQCHGPDREQRQADLRLDDPESALADRNGSPVIVPGSPDESELIRRITSDDVDLRMPPAESERQLNAEQIELLRQWIAAGAEYESHWAFLPVERPGTPKVTQTEWPNNPIDHFVLHKLEKEGLSPSPPAGKATLIRRVTLDLTGMPPTPEEVDAFLADETPGAYERVVDRLLASPCYGERMALVWLDAARFADSGGYQGDILRSMWLWRDWVIDAYNANMPFDRFTIEQLAGDLLPEPTQSQRIATGFNRNHRINDEDGIILEEFRVEYVADRAETTAKVWLGLTMNCARCHDHKYDPIRQEDYYRLFAFFNSINEKGRGHGNAPPLLSVPTENQQQQLERLSERIEKLKVSLNGSDETQQETLKNKLATLKKQQQSLQAQIPTVMVMRELPEPRATHVLVRGAYNRPGKEVAPGPPQFLTAPDRPPLHNRLDLARWMTSPNNPLTARVAVNRYWQMYFGRGFVETPEDFGTQGSLPTHPALLDWLASEFVRTGWNVKQMQRLIVTSQTYRQSSAGSMELLARDPVNRLLARGPRFRLDAETIRDQALAASGLLVGKIGGPSVKPYQPTGLWQELASASREYQQGTGDDLYRRSLYTFIRRTVPPPAMIAFDSPNRELCTVRRPRTNTPLQALGIMNDPTYIEAARALATRVLVADQSGSFDRLRRAFRLLLTRTPSQAELVVLNSSLAHFEERYENDLDASKALISVGESKPPEQLDPRELAAYTSVCLMLLNLDETLTKE